MNCLIVLLIYYYIIIIIIIIIVRGVKEVSQRYKLKCNYNPDCKE